SAGTSAGRTRRRGVRGSREAVRNVRVDLIGILSVVGGRPAGRSAVSASRPPPHQPAPTPSRRTAVATTARTSRSRW
ncbi:hypothetical protein, partial [Streptomyces sp. Isolate_45]|uniref:hypothetical protein n=1 Tax=Streptomyces sp. Isolate_45 TaxID=2950111 RepID=UPI002481EEAA